MSFLGHLCHGWVVCTVLGLLLCLGAICAIHGVFALSVGHECHAQAVFIMLKLFSSVHVILELLVAVCVVISKGFLNLKILFRVIKSF